MMMNKHHLGEVGKKNRSKWFAPIFLWYDRRRKRILGGCMDVLSKLLMSLDAFRFQISRKNKKEADDYYEVVAPVDAYSFKMTDGGMVSFFELQGFNSTLDKQAKIELSKRLERDFDGFFPKVGYTIQIVDIADPELSEKYVRDAMSASIEELGNMGINHEILTEDYVKFVSNISTWKKQYAVVYTSPLVMRGEKVHKTKKSKSQEEEISNEVLAETNIIKKDGSEQSLFLSDLEKSIYRKHVTFAKHFESTFLKAGVMLESLEVGDAASVQKRTLYGKGCPWEWKPTFDRLFGVKEGDMSAKPGEVSIKPAGMLEQVISKGGDERDLPPEVLRFGDRFFTTLSMVIPQQIGSRMKTYAELVTGIPKNVGFMSSYRISSDPFSDPSHKYNKIITGMGAMIPSNLKIQKAITKMGEDKENTTYVFLELTITLFAYSVDELLDNCEIVNGKIATWNQAHFRTSELDKTQGLFDSLPGASRKNHMFQVYEELGSVFFQSPIFLMGSPYDNGYLHFTDPYGQQFSYQDHAYLAMNYNMYICGTTGAGKSTLLTLLNLALLAKPKANPKLRGEFPFILNVDFGKTSFGLSDALETFTDEKKRHQIFTHEMTTSVKSAYNPHDLPIGRTKPTMRHKLALSRFMLLLIGGIKDNGAGKSVFKYPEMESMVKYMIDVVFQYRQEENHPRNFAPAEFKFTNTLEFMKKHGIEANGHSSYYHLADQVMLKDPIKGVRHATLLRRYGFPRLQDYSLVISQNPSLAARYDTGNIEGKTVKNFFIEKVGEVANEFPCFTRPTKLNIDVARMISIDIKNICGEDEYRKGVFGTLSFLMFLVKKENLEESADLMSDVKPQYIKALERMDHLNRALPGVLNIEEAHVLFDVMDKSLTENARQNRKGNWGIRALSQNLVDPSDTFFGLCGTVMITSPQSGKTLPQRVALMEASQEEQQVISKKLYSREMFLFIRTTSGVGRIGLKLRTDVSSGLLWISTSNQADIDFRRDVIKVLGKDEAYVRLARFFKGGQVKSYFDGKQASKYLNIAKENGYESTYEYFLDVVCNNTKLPPALAVYL
jgi:energy-coupling factor transporter ATP-binding protein EcfA2